MCAVALKKELQMDVTGGKLTSYGVNLRVQRTYVVEIFMSEKLK